MTDKVLRMAPNALAWVLVRDEDSFANVHCEHCQGIIDMFGMEGESIIQARQWCSDHPDGPTEAEQRMIDSYPNESSTDDGY
jgi:hypothetical protein